jgi:hypothetical protein
MKYPNLNIKQKKNNKVKLGIAAALIIASTPFVYKLYKNHKLYEEAPIIEHKVEKGESLWKYFEAENTKENLNFNSYKDLVMRLNDFYINGIERNIDNPNRLIPGKVISLPDINRNGYVANK